MIEIDGSEKSGSGTILRLSIALASIQNEGLHVYNIRKKRKNPGLRPQHLEAVLTAAKLTNGKVKGAHLGSQEIWLYPDNLKGGVFESEIGTAGSIPMLFMTVLPICLFSKSDVSLRVRKGGTDTRGSPTMNYMKNVALEVLEKMGVKASIEIKSYGYYPVGMGEAVLHTKPVTTLRNIYLEERGEINEIKGISVSTFLKDRRVSERQAASARKELMKNGYKSEIEVIYDESNPLQRGSSIVLWAETDKGAIIGSDAIGQLGKPSEKVGSEAADNLLMELKRKTTVDIHMADMLIPYIALAKGCSLYLTREISDHLETNMWLTEKMLGVEFGVKKTGDLYEIQKM
jgi:RNA 3'-terminal phosphate cyclase (ATP)